MRLGASVFAAPTPLSRKTWIGIIAVMLIGLALRVGWIMLQPPGRHMAGEARRVAVSLATTGTFGNALYAGEGPTAHLTPTSPAIAGGVFSIFGVDSPAANFILASWCLLQVFSSFLLLLLLFRKLGTPALGLLLALAALCFLPILIGDETVQFRYWDAALAVNLAVATLLVLISLDGRGDPGWRWMVGAGFLAAMTMIVTPTLGLGIYAAAGIYLWRNLSWERMALAVGIAGLVLAALVTPWAIRNYRVMGAPILLRDNAGMQMAVANYPEAVHTRDMGPTYEKRLREVSPYFNDDLKTALEAAGGEVAYNKKLARETKAWIKAHPREFAYLTMRHFTEFYWPRGWQFRHTGSGSLARERAAFVSLVSFFGFIGLAWGLWRRRPGYIYLLPAVLLPGLAYAMFQPLPRYTYLIYGLLVFLAADGLSRWLIVDGRLRWSAASR